MSQLPTHDRQYTTNHGDVYCAFELGNKNWKLGFTVGFGQKPRERTILAGDLATVKAEIDLAKRRFDLPENTSVLICYEAGRDGFWLHRYLIQIGVSRGGLLEY